MKQMKVCVFAVIASLYVTVLFTSCSNEDNIGISSNPNDTLINIRNVTIGGMKYYLYPETHEASINSGNTWVGELEIPSEINFNGQTYCVNGISYRAFYDCKELTRVKISRSLDHVVHHVLSDDPEKTGAVSPESMNPFARCTALESIEVDESNPAMKSVGGLLFSKDETELYCYPAGNKAEKYVVPESVTWIGSNVFAFNEHLVSVELPKMVTKLSGSVFQGCKKLEEVKLPENLAILKAYMFRDCSSLRIVDLPSSVKFIGEYAFSGCSSLRALVIRGALDDSSLDRSIFYGMDASTVIYTPASEVGKIKRIYSGDVLPLEKYD